MVRKKQKFIRAGYRKYSKLGKRRKKKLKYRKARGIDSKVRLKKKGRLRNVEIGFRSEKAKRNLIDGKILIKVNNIKDLKKIKKNCIGIVAKIGDKRKIQIAKKAKEMKIELLNLNPERFLQEVNIKLEKIKENKKKKKEKKKGKEKKTKKEKKEKKEKTPITDKKMGEKERGSNGKSNINKEQEEAVKNYETDVKEEVEEKK